MPNNKDLFIRDMDGHLGDNVDISIIADKLDKLGFFNAPASINHHGNVDGGLFDHSKEVMFQLIYLTEKLNLSWGRPESPYIVGMFHDLCKCDNYKKIKIQKPVMYSDEVEVLLEEKWEYNKDILLPGHGEKSVIMALKLLGYLTEEEIMCIRWHMGAFDDKDNWKYYSASVRDYPNVLFTHTADMIASQICTI